MGDRLQVIGLENMMFGNQQAGSDMRTRSRGKVAAKASNSSLSGGVWGWAKIAFGAMLAVLLSASATLASEADLAIPDLHAAWFNIPGVGTINGWNLLFFGSFVICGTLGISLTLKSQIYKLPAHKSQLSVAEIIF